MSPELSLTKLVETPLIIDSTGLICERYHISGV